MRKPRPVKTKKSRASRSVARRAWLSKKKFRALRARASRESAFDGWRVARLGREAGPAPSRADRDLALALGRRPFRIQRLARALCRGASFQTAVFGPIAGQFSSAGLAPAPAGGVFESEAAFERWRSAEALMRSLWATRERVSWEDHSGFATSWRGPADKKLWPLWEWMEGSGADMEAVDERGEGFDHFALRLGNLSALQWWASKGRGPGRPGAPSLARSALARDQLHLLDDVARVWPGVDWEAERGEALRGAAGVIIEYWGSGREEDGTPKFSRFSQIRARAAAARAAEAIVAGDPQAARPNRELSDLLGLLGVRAWRKELMALEDAAMARREREEIEQVARKPGGSGAKAL